MLHQNFLLKSNNPTIISELEQIGFKKSNYCNDGIFILVERGVIMLVNHIPYKKFIDFDNDENGFLRFAKSVFF